MQPYKMQNDVVLKLKMTSFWFPSLKHIGAFCSAPFANHIQPRKPPHFGSLTLQPPSRRCTLSHTTNAHRRVCATVHRGSHCHSLSFVVRLLKVTHPCLCRPLVMPLLRRVTHSHIAIGRSLKSHPLFALVLMVGSTSHLQ